MHVHCLHWLKSTGLLYLNAFCQPCKSTTGEMAPKEGSQFGCGYLIWLPLSMHVSLGLVVEYWCFVDASTRHSYSELYHLCPISSLFKLLPPSTPPPHPSHPPSNIHWPNINEFHEKNRKKLVKTSHYLLVRLVVQ